MGSGSRTCTVSNASMRPHERSMRERLVREGQVQQEEPEVIAAAERVERGLVAVDSGVAVSHSGCLPKQGPRSVGEGFTLVAGDTGGRSSGHGRERRMAARLVKDIFAIQSGSALEKRDRPSWKEGSRGCCSRLPVRPGTL
jgi:hypothetical protein